jgi:hypothetical protein
MSNDRAPKPAPEPQECQCGADRNNRSQPAHRHAPHALNCPKRPAPEPQEDNLQAALILERDRYKAQATALRRELRSALNDWRFASQRVALANERLSEVEKERDALKAEVDELRRRDREGSLFPRSNHD